MLLFHSAFPPQPPFLFVLQGQWSVLLYPLSSSQPTLLTLLKHTQLWILYCIPEGPFLVRILEIVEKGRVDQGDVRHFGQLHEYPLADLEMLTKLVHGEEKKPTMIRALYTRSGYIESNRGNDRTHIRGIRHGV